MNRERFSDKLHPAHPQYECVEALRLFFANKTWYNGGPVPKHLVFTEKNRNVLNNTSWDNALKLGYMSIARKLQKGEKLAKTTNKRNVDIFLALKIIHQCHHLHIPRYFVGGLFLLYLKLCENVDLV